MENNPSLSTNHNNTNEHNNASNDISIKIKCMDNEFMVEVNTSDNIELLKKKIETVSKVPINRQRLIFQGKLLKNEEKISIYKITHLDVIHMVAKIGDLNSSQSSNTSQPEPTSQGRHNTSNTIQNLMGNLLRGEATNTRSSHHSTGVVAFNETECKETIVQNITQVNEIIQCGNYDKLNNYDQNILTNEQSLSCIDFTKRKLVLGQWVDVKDTVNQWLEGQVISVQGDIVQVHYNKWGTRWDEKIEMSSNRIMPFRFYTRQSSITNYQSPYPNSKPDANINLVSSLQNDDSTNNNATNPRTFLSLFDDVTCINNTCSSMIGAIRNNTTTDQSHKQLETVYLMKQLIPVLDRMGRIMVDMSYYMNNSIKKNKLEDLDSNLFQGVQANCPLLKAFSSDEQKVSNEETLRLHIQRERNGSVHIIPPTNIFDKKVMNQIPLIDTPVTISNRNIMLQPVVDIYVHTFLYPTQLIGARASLNSTNNANEPSSLSSNDHESHQENNQLQNENEDQHMIEEIENDDNEPEVEVEIQSSINAANGANDNNNGNETEMPNIIHTEEENNNNEEVLNEPIDNPISMLGHKRNRNDDNNSKHSNKGSKKQIDQNLNEDENIDNNTEEKNNTQNNNPSGKTTKNKKTKEKKNKNDKKNKKR